MGTLSITFPLYVAILVVVSPPSIMENKAWGLRALASPPPRRIYGTRLAERDHAVVLVDELYNLGAQASARLLHFPEEQAMRQRPVFARIRELVWER